MEKPMTHPLAQPLDLPSGATLSNGVGLVRPLIADPEAPRRLLAREIHGLPAHEATLNAFHILPWNSMRIERLGDGLDPDLSLTGEVAITVFVALEGRNMAALLDRRGRRAA
jgi:hypothetical protein